MDGTRGGGGGEPVRRTEAHGLVADERLAHALALARVRHRRFERGSAAVMLNRGDYWQCAFVIPKGGFADLRRRGLPAFRQAIVELLVDGPGLFRDRRVLQLLVVGMVR